MMTLSRMHLHITHPFPQIPCSVHRTYACAHISRNIDMHTHYLQRACHQTHNLSPARRSRKATRASIPSTSVFLVLVRISGSGGSTSCIRGCTTVVSPSAPRRQAECPQ
jgi:hypothetical protein